MSGRASSVNPRENVSGPHFDREQCFTFDDIEHRNSSDPVFPLLQKGANANTNRASQTVSN